MEHKHISKGIYQHSQIGNFISVKNYIFIRKNEKICEIPRPDFVRHIGRHREKRELSENRGC